MASNSTSERYARLAIAVAERYKDKIKQRALLEWFAWENGFEKELDFPEWVKHRYLGPAGKRNAAPPSCGGAFVGSVATQNENDETKQDFNLVIDLPKNNFVFEFVKNYTFEAGYQVGSKTELYKVREVPNDIYPDCLLQDPVPQNCTPTWLQDYSEWILDFPSPVPFSTAQEMLEDSGGARTDGEELGTGSVGFVVEGSLQDFSFTPERAKTNLKTFVSGEFTGGQYWVGSNHDEGQPPYANPYEFPSSQFLFWTAIVYFSDLFTSDGSGYYYPKDYTLPENGVNSFWYRLRVDDEHPDTIISQEIDVALYDNEIFQDNAQGARDKFQETIDIVNDVKSLDGSVEQKGIFKITGKDNEVLFETPMFARTVFPIRNFVLTYKIKKFNWDPPEPPPE